VRQDVVGMLYRHEELAAAGAPAVPKAEIRETLGRGPSVSVALWDLTRRGRLARTPAGYRLTDRGRDEARQLVRSHRLWETYLVTVLGSDPERVHDRAERVEHVIDPVLQERLDEASGYPQRDPHEDEIPAGPEHDPSG
jgi:Mn-dependent DtxR family transcriptional regulator